MSPAFRIEGLDDLDKALDALCELAGQSAEATVGTNLVSPPYPYFLEFGTSRMAARPSARPAFDESKDEAIRVVGDTLGQLIEGGKRDPQILRLSLEAGAHVIANRWKERAPVRTGTYRRSIHVESELTSGPVGDPGGQP